MAFTALMRRKSGCGTQSVAAIAARCAIRTAGERGPGKRAAQMTKVSGGSSLHLRCVRRFRRHARIQSEIALVRAKDKQRITSRFGMKARPGSDCGAGNDQVVVTGQGGPSVADRALKTGSTPSARPAEVLSGHHNRSRPAASGPDACLKFSCIARLRSDSRHDTATRSRIALTL